MLTNGQHIGHYQILSAIGAGGMGEVYLAEDTRLDRKVALKILPKEFAEDTDRMNRFVREAKSASALNHPNIITIYEIGKSDGTHFIATEFIDGKTLNEYAKHDPLNFKSVLEIAIQIASALDEAHMAGIVHRDIKPDNVMVRANGLVKLLDFEIAKLSDSNTQPNLDAEAATAIKSGTTPGMIIGTKEEITKQFDVYSALRPSVKNQVSHISVSLKPGEHLDEEQKLNFAEKLLEKLDFQKERVPYLVVEHHDKEYDHFHIVAREDSGTKEPTDEFISINLTITEPKLKDAPTHKHEREIERSQNFGMEM
jgi:serine/threonine protein kinase